MEVNAKDWGTELCAGQVSASRPEHVGAHLLLDYELLLVMRT